MSHPSFERGRAHPTRLRVDFPGFSGQVASAAEGDADVHEATYRTSPRDLRFHHCRDNFIVEPFFSSLKKERIKKQIYKNRALATADVADDIDSFYNETRRHNHIGGVSPEQFEVAHTPRRQGLH